MHRRVKAKLIIEIPVEKKGLDLGYDDWLTKGKKLQMALQVEQIWAQEVLYKSTNWDLPPSHQDSLYIQCNPQYIWAQLGIMNTLIT